MSRQLTPKCCSVTCGLNFRVLSYSIGDPACHSSSLSLKPEILYDTGLGLDGTEAREPWVRRPATLWAPPSEGIPQPKPTSNFPFFAVSPRLSYDGRDLEWTPSRFCVHQLARDRRGWIWCQSLSRRLPLTCSELFKATRPEQARALSSIAFPQKSQVAARSAEERRSRLRCHRGRARAEESGGCF